MKWGELNQEYDNRAARVSAKSTPKEPELGEGPFWGVIKFFGGEVPVLQNGRELRYFADWWDVEIVVVDCPKHGIGPINTWHLHVCYICGWKPEMGLE